METKPSPTARTLVRARPAQTAWVVGALLTSLGLAAASSPFAGVLPGAWTAGSLVVLLAAATYLAIALRGARGSD